MSAFQSRWISGLIVIYVRISIAMDLWAQSVFLLPLHSRFKVWQWKSHLGSLGNVEIEAKQSP